MAETIANTSPIQYLHQLGRLNLLRELFGRIMVPTPVISELDAGRQCGVPLPELRGIEWIEIVAESRRSPRLLAWDLGSGELAVLSLALERPGCVAILDDRLAREAALWLKIRFVGTAGILIRAKRAGLLPSVSIELQRLQDLGFRLTPQTRKNILDLAGE